MPRIIWLLLDVSNTRSDIDICSFPGRYYPDLNAGTCVNGTDFPEWMASDVDFKRMYLFKTLGGCCKQWFTDFDLDGCIANVIQGEYAVEPCPTNRPECNNNTTIANATDHLLGMFYPDLGTHVCKNDRQMPSWMLADGYQEWYLFNSRDQCCAAFGFCWILVTVTCYIVWSLYLILQLLNDWSWTFT